MKRTKRISGIQKKYLKYTVLLLSLTLLLFSVGSWFFMQQEVTSAIVEKYAFMNEKMGISLDTLFRKSDEVLAECIFDDDVQKSLSSQPLEEVERNALSKYFAYVDLENVREYCYVDNKEHVYSRSYSKIGYEDFQASKLAEKLGDSYAKTRWFRTSDRLFGNGEKEIFIGRYVHSMEYAHEPGMLFFKMEKDFLKVITEKSSLSRQVAVGVMDADGEMWSSWYPERYQLSQTDKELLCELVANTHSNGTILSGAKLQSGVLSAYRQAETGLIVYTIIPNAVLSQGLNRMLLAMVGLYLLVIAIAVIFSVYFSSRFTKPITVISKAMTGFDGNDFSKTVEINTNTELDQIGNSYNEMLGNIETLLQEIKSQERELRTSELETLMSQINPHFLYNTLDTIYMLARMNGEETTMKMIQALSKYLRLSLSKGNDIVTVEDELENVKSYMEIQQIRNENLFRYELDCQVNAKETWVLKLILQPLVENAIKHGFCEIYEGGLIRISMKEEKDGLLLEVYNSGMPIREEMAERVNALNHKPLSEVKACFPDKKQGYGIANVITRLRLKYGEDVRFEFEAQQDGTSCRIWIPANEGKTDEG